MWAVWLSSNSLDSLISWLCTCPNCRESCSVHLHINRRKLWSFTDHFFLVWFQNEDRVLWKLGTLPPGLMTFYGLTHPLNKSWHVLGLGYSPSIDRTEIENAAVVHYNGNMKPWLEIAMTKYRPYWSKYVKYNHPYLRNCKLSEWSS
jgi:hypothetical protein